ncbi:Clock-controlled protein 6 [Colletotrichum sp. SAR 10_70]|nr:Clock-controlled protein 6 [Colletotrichum sp. SAR 10_70]
MKSMQILAPAAGLFAVANAWGTDVHTSYTTIVTTAYETYCPPPHHNGTTSTTVIVVTPPAETTLAGVTPVVPPQLTTTKPDSPPTNTPVGPTTTRPVTVPGSGAEHLGAGLGAVALAGLFALLI